MASGSPAVAPSKIAAAFYDYYAQLYHLPSMFPGLTTNHKAEHVQQYLEKAQSHKLSTQVSTQLDAPISLTELVEVIKDLPNREKRRTRLLYECLLPLISPTVS